MLTFKNTNIVFLLLLAICLMLHVEVIKIPFWIYLILILFYSLIVFYGCINIQSGFFIPVVCSAKTSEKVIAISFDDGPVAEDTLKILQILSEHEIEAAFFCIGSRVRGNENILCQMVSEGHIIGNHSYSHHFFFDLFSSKKMLQELKSTDKEIQAAAGFTPAFFRPPYGVTNPNIKKAIIKGNYIPIGWTVRSMDTVIKDEKKLFKKITEQIHSGAIYLFHDTSKITQATLSLFIDFVKENGYKIIRLDKMLHLNSYA